jgi:hypothetical protein
MKKGLVTLLFFLALVPRAFAEEVSARKLDQVLENQTEILKRLAEIKSELEVVKVRATR